MSSHTRPSTPVPQGWALVAILTVALGAWYTVYGFWYGPFFSDDGYRDVAYSRALIELGYSPLRYLREAQAMSGHPHTVPLAGYMIYVYVLAVLQSLTGAQWMSSLVLANAAMHTLAASAVLSLVNKTLPGRTALVAGAVAMAIAMDGYQWVAMTQSDSMYVGMGAITLTCAILASSGAPERRPVRWLGVAVLLVASALTRPTWPPLAAAIGVAALLSGPFLRANATAMIGTWWRLAAAGAAVVIVGTLVLVAAYRDLSLVPFDVMLRPMTVWRDYLENGVVVIARPETMFPPLDTYWGFLRVVLARLVYYFWFVGEGFSRTHRIANIAGHVPLYLFAAMGVLSVLRNRIGPGAVHVGLVLISYVLALDAYHAVTILDFDWRYRAPAYPAFAYLAAVGVISLRGWLVRRFARS